MRKKYISKAAIRLWFFSLPLSLRRDTILDRSLSSVALLLILLLVVFSTFGFGLFGHDLSFLL